MAAESEDSASWGPKARLAWTIRAVAMVVPFGLAVAAGLLVCRLLPGPDSSGQRVLWWLLASAAAVLVLQAAQRVARRLLPLSTLLSMTVVFPDHAPARLSVALRANLKKRLPDLELADNGGAQGAAEHLLAMVAALSRHDRRTIGHSERVRAYATLLADELGLTTDESAKLQWAALLHDVGKLDVAAEILNRPGKLDDTERALVFGHPSAGERRAALLVAWLGRWANGIWEHHEKVDGTGYPLGLRGIQISYAGRVIAVCDSFEVMTAARSYKKPVSLAAARAELVRCAGTHFDAEIVRAFMNISLGDLRVVAGPLAAFTRVPYLAGSLSGAAGSAVAAGFAAATIAVVGPGVQASSAAAQGVSTVASAITALRDAGTAITAPVSPATSVYMKLAALPEPPATTPDSSPAPTTGEPTSLANTTVARAPTTAAVNTTVARTTTATPHGSTTVSVTTTAPTTTAAPQGSTTVAITTTTATTTAPTTTSAPTTVPVTTTTAPTTTTTAAAPTKVLVSLNANRSSPVPANDASFGGGSVIYLFAVPPTGTTSVSFYVNGAFARTDTVAPYDLAGTKSNGDAKKYKLPSAPGTLTVTVQTQLAGGSTQTTTATISVT